MNKKQKKELLIPISIPIPNETISDRWALPNTSPLENLRRGIDLIRKGKL